MNTRERAAMHLGRACRRAHNRTLSDPALVVLVAELIQMRGLTRLQAIKAARSTLSRRRQR